jgi:hypothetical protein
VVLAAHHGKPDEPRTLEFAHVLDTAFNEMGNGTASSVTSASPRVSRARIARRGIRERAEHAVEVRGMFNHTVEYGTDRRNVKAGRTGAPPRSDE